MPWLYIRRSRFPSNKLGKAASVDYAGSSAGDCLNEYRLICCVRFGDNFSILALDGGGTRGIYAALVRVEEALGVPVRDSRIAGTSTGSIVAAGAAAGIPMATIADLFEGESKRILANHGSLRALPCCSVANIRA